VEDVPQIEELADACGLRSADEGAPWWDRTALLPPCKI
jgi:hypothetical protein